MSDENINVPNHVAIIMDGNGRWAESKGFSRLEGHRVGTDNINRVVLAFGERGVNFITLFAFSTENWNRPNEEVEGLFQILAETIDREVVNLHKEGVKLHHLGNLDRLTGNLQKKIRDAVELTKNNSKIQLNLAFNYGGRADILNAVSQIIKAGICPEDINEETFTSYLYTHGIPDPDLIIRTAGEMRLSNFLIWQTAYSEYYSTPTLWPDLDDQDIIKALETYSQRERRFGGLCPNGREGNLTVSHFMNS